MDWKKEFDRKHGEGICKDQMKYFPDGARRGMNAEEEVWEPPRDPTERGKVILKYHKLRLDAARKAFIALKEECASDAMACVREKMSPPPEWRAKKAKLLELQKLALTCAAKVQETEKALEETDEKKIKKQLTARELKSAEEYRVEIDNIRI